MAKTQRQKRHKARILAMQALFQLDTRKTESLTASDLNSFSWIDYEVPEEEREYARAIIGAALDHLAEIDTMISDRLVNWDFSRISGVSRAILRTGVAQLLYMANEADAAVVIDECILLAKQYDEGQAVAFVNGVLDDVYREKFPEAQAVRKKIAPLQPAKKIRIRVPAVAKKSDRA
ncbi:transcription antitermination factor NusB [Turneriella parva]|uniref:Transcription antitermination protein NusB n=1 Tax=Turneriella parva (strain ATCC BAA-1111 / DSM 21527 / NCTC 11395 / H) TaxID=869212 RepID=I4B7H8_TURPD|nr:transcription antitermination factor NusB [Turneriella parva]AFM13235.1 NusB antitermination factor [Turneriella parva DSM 21527]